MHVLEEQRQIVNIRYSMTGTLFKKYHVVIMDDDQEFVRRMVIALKSWYRSRVVIKIYSTPAKMFEGINMSKAKKIPIDLTILSEDDYAEKMILQQTNPEMPVLLCHDECGMKLQASKVLV